MIQSYKKSYKNLPLQVKASIWFLICSFIQKIISIITTPVFTRLLSTTEYGEYNVFYSWLGIISVFVTLNIFYSPYETGLVRYENDRKHLSSSLQGLELVLCSIWGVIYFFFREHANKVLGLSSLQMVLMLVIIWSSAAYSFWAAEQRVDYKYKKLVVFTLVVAFLQPLLGILLVLNIEDRVIGRILGIAVTNTVIYTILFFSQITNGKRIFDREYWMYALKFSIPLIPHYLSQIILVNSDRIMIERLDCSSNAGIYSLAYSISVILTIFNTSINQAISPYVFRKIKNNKTNEIVSVTYASMTMIVILSFVMIAISPEIVKIFAPTSYYEAIYVIPPITMSVLFMFSCDQYVRFQYYFKMTKWISFVTVIGAAVNVILNFILIPVFGYYAAGYTTLLGYVIYAGLHYVLMIYACKKEMNTTPPYEFKIILMFGVINILLGMSFIPLYNYVLVRYIIILAVLVVACIFRKKIVGLFKDLMLFKNEHI